MNAMLLDTLLMSLLAAVFATAGVQHLLVVARNAGAIDHFWFGAVCVAAAGAALVQGPVYRDAAANDGFMAHDVPRLLTAAWLMTAIWFGAAYSLGDHKRRWAALFATILVGIACAGALGTDASARPSASPSSIGVWHLAGLAALALALLLVFDGGVRLWSAARRVRAAALGGLGIVLFVVLVQAASAGSGFPGLPPLALSVFLPVVLLTMYELAGAVAEREAVLQRQQQELVHASRLSIVGELTASLAHEINQPLGAILSNVDAGEILLEHADPPLGEVRQILADIRRDGLRASGVITHVRKLVRKREIEFERLDANTVATDVVALLESQARVRRIFVARTLSPTPAYVRGDRALIEQVLINLVMNAMDAVEAVGAADELPSARAPVALAVLTTSHGEVEFEIVDAGTGIPADRLDHLFDSFYTSKAHGMGLGLSIARSIVESHGGRIHAANNGEAGATFRVTLPPFDDAAVDPTA